MLVLGLFMWDLVWLLRDLVGLMMVGLCDLAGLLMGLLMGDLMGLLVGDLVRLLMWDLVGLLMWEMLG